jgi:dTDP-4-dehydrorhamnose 3,5-epimerase
MKIEYTNINGLSIIHTNISYDVRGYFHSLYDVKEMKSLGVDFSPAQGCLSKNIKAGTLRGLHYQAYPSEQKKLVRCTSGALFDVILDIRLGSASFGKWYGINLRAGDEKAIFIPPGLAHGFITLEDDTDILYELDLGENIDRAMGVRWDDPLFNIQWPLRPVVINDRDQSWPDFM